MAESKKRGFRTALSHTGRKTKHEHGFVNPPLNRGSTVLVPTVAARQALQARRGERVLSYGLGGAQGPRAPAGQMAAVGGGASRFLLWSGPPPPPPPRLAGRAG